MLENKGAEKIVKKLGVLEKSFDEKSDNRLELAACGSMLNVASDDGISPIFSHNMPFLIIVVCLVARPLIWSEAEGDLVVIRTSI